MKEYLFHGGSLSKEHFDGHTFWTRNEHRAAEYAGDSDEIWVIEIDLASETVADEDDYRDGDYTPDMDPEENWELQTAAIRAAVASGATVVLCDDGLVVVGAQRLNPRKVTLEEAEDLAEQNA